MQFKINENALHKIKGIKLGILMTSGLHLKSDKPDFNTEFEAIKTLLFEKFRNIRPAEDEVVSHVRRMYRRVGWEPTRYRPSSEALIRRILKGNDLYRINIAVDFGNLVSARYHIPMGLYDTGKIKGDITLDTGKEDESYEGISKPLIHAKDKLILRDNKSVFGNPTADSRRTSLDNNSKDVLAVFFCPFEVSDSYLNETLDLLEKFYGDFSIIDSKEIQRFEG